MPGRQLGSLCRLVSLRSDEIMTSFRGVWVRQTEPMHWETVEVDQLRVGDLVKHRSGQEFVVARIDSPFLGRSDLVCLIEDTPTRWHAYPTPVPGTIERQSSSG